MNAKKWIAIFICATILALCGLASFNYFADPYGYFTFQSGDYEDINFSFNLSVVMARQFKANHVLKFADQYDAYLLGGSKAGSYRAAKLSELDGYRYYNMFESRGNVQEYEIETDFLLKYCDPKKIVISLSGAEVKRLLQDQEDVSFQIPAVELGTSYVREYMTYLFKDFFQGLTKIRNRSATYVEPIPTGERNIYRLYNRSYERWVQATESKVLGEFQEHLRELFTSEADDPYIPECLDTLERIKKKCDDAGVELMVIVAPSFIGEIADFESPAYRDYLVRLALITDYWDFSGYHDIDLNPWNFYNEGHFFYEVGDAVVDTINGTFSYPGFGTHVTRENAMDHVKQRESDYLRLKDEYLTTGTIRLQTAEDPSCLVHLPSPADREGSTGLTEETEG